METSNYQYIDSGKAPVKAWINGVEMQDEAKEQLCRVARLPFIHKHVAAMPDVHWGIGATIGSVIATKKAIIPAACGVDLGCGMIAKKVGKLTAEHLPESLHEIRSDIEAKVPVGFSQHKNGIEYQQRNKFETFANEKHPKMIGGKRGLDVMNHQYGSLGGGNHFIEICLDENNDVWVMLHSGSRGIGNQIGRYFISKAKEEMERYHIKLEDKNLSYLPQGTDLFDDYIFSMLWAQEYASENRKRMMDLVLNVIRKHFPFADVRRGVDAINCHHNYAQIENHFGENVYVTRKGAVRAREGDLGIIPGSMGVKSYIVRGKGNPDSFHSCSHGAGRMMSRKKARKVISLDDHKKATEGVECKKDASVLDESPAAYKPIDKVMKAQEDLVDIVHTLKQVVCVKG